MSIRLDRFLAESGYYSRREASRTIRAGAVTVNGETVRDPDAKISEDASVSAEGRALGFSRTRWIMLSKPAGTVSTTEDDPKSVMKLLPEHLRRVGLFPCGRLDIDTTGLLILTSDGAAAHNLLSPRHHCEKVYSFVCLPLGEEQRQRLEAGVELSDFVSAPCRVSMEDPEHGEIAVTEGKYHQKLERVSFGGVKLDRSLAPGEWREMTEEEIALLTSPGTE